MLAPKQGDSRFRGNGGLGYFGLCSFKKTLPFLKSIPISQNILIPQNIPIPPNILIPKHSPFPPHSPFAPHSPFPSHSPFPPHSHSRESGNLPIPAPSAQITKRSDASVARPASTNREIPAFAGMGDWVILGCALLKNTPIFKKHPHFPKHSHPQNIHSPKHSHSKTFPFPPHSPSPHIPLSPHIPFPPYSPFPSHSPFPPHSHSRESGNLPIPAPSAQIVKRSGASVARPQTGRFPLSREWNRRAGMGKFEWRN